jgi:subfamily B ATP-binding cassette protein MsbA
MAIRKSRFDQGVQVVPSNPMRPFPRRRGLPSRSDETVDLDFREQLGQLGDLFTYLRPYRGWLVAAIGGVAVASALGLVFPLIMGDLVDTAIGADTTTGSLDRTALLLLGVFFAQALFNYVRSYSLAVVGEGVVADLRKSVYARIVRLPVPFFDTRRTGEITSRLTSDASVIQATVSTAVAQSLAQTITLIGGVVLMLVLSPLLSLTILVFLPVAIVAAAVFGRRLNRISTRFQDEIATANAFAEESIGSIRVVKWFTAEEESTRRYDHSIGKSYEVALRRARLRALFVPGVTFVAFGTLALVLWVGGRQVIAGTMTAGELVSFLLYTLTVAGAIGTFTGLYSQLQEALGASRRIFELLGEPPEVHDPPHPTTPPSREGSVRFEHVSFSYSGRDTGVLHDIDLSIAPGEVVALVGPSGSGKTTITQLIPRFYDVDTGRVIATNPSTCCALRWPQSPRRSSSSRARSPRTSGCPGPMRVKRNSSEPARRQMPTRSSLSSLMGTRRSWEREESSFPEVSVNAWRSHEHCSPTHASSSSMRPRLRSMPSRRAWSRKPWSDSWWVGPRS